MVTRKLDHHLLEQAVETLNTLLANGHAGPDATGQGPSAMNAACAQLGLSDSTLRSRLKIAKRDLGLEPNWSMTIKITPTTPKPFELPRLPSELPTAEALIVRRKNEYERKHAASEARRLVPVKIKINGPIAIAHLGDPHVDNPGTDLGKLERHMQVINATEGMFGANVGDLHDNWVGRLARLYSESSTTAAEAWVLVEWMVRSVQWLYLLAGNHDCWSGAGDPVKWIASHAGLAYEAHGSRLNLLFPGRKDGVRVNARHDFPGHSMWNSAHGPAKAVQMGWRDHILTCGHKHTSGYQFLKDPATGLISHALRVAGYKIHDRYAIELGLPDGNITPTSVTIIDPRFADDDPRLITVIHDVETAAEFLTWLRARK